MHRDMSVKPAWVRGLCAVICGLALAAVLGALVGHGLSSASRGTARDLQNPFEHSRIGQ